MMLKVLVLRTLALSAGPETVNGLRAGFLLACKGPHAYLCGANAMRET
jgi:hypothetical protein